MFNGARFLSGLILSLCIVLLNLMSSGSLLQLTSITEIDNVSLAESFLEFFEDEKEGEDSDSWLSLVALPQLDEKIYLNVQNLNAFKLEYLLSGFKQARAPPVL